MKVLKSTWDQFLDHNKFYFTPITRHPITGKWPHDGEIIIDVSDGILNGKLAPRAPSELIDVPDEWLLPVNKKSRPPVGDEKIHAYYLSEAGFFANRDRLMKGYCYASAKFDKFEECLLGIARHYQATIDRRKKRAAAQKVRRK